jgi:hypothetical protein
MIALGVKMRCGKELREFLNDQQPQFVKDFEELLKAAHSKGPDSMKCHLESLWARYNMLLALAERFANRADACWEEKSWLFGIDTDKPIKR